ncbi:alpha/beta hydrolase [Streptomyces sp. NPDC093097]|uniref:alpha/beta hydrolase n=1 Tax=Streptomyces sp. NPDC093097 TaxID=3366027 RepID=UPI00381ECEB2
MADADGYAQQARILRAMSTPDRMFFTFDPGGSKAAEVIGDLTTAKRIAVMVPGANTTLATFESSDSRAYKLLGGGARALYDEMRRQRPDTPAAVIAWLGYHPPAAFDIALLTTSRADTGARKLHDLIVDVERVAPSAQVSLFCHSYGSVVCGRAANGLHIADMAFYASPGTGASHASELRTGARIWAGAGSNDWITRIPHSRIGFFHTTVGLGTDPVSKSFGARRFNAGQAAHSTYLRPGSVSLKSLARIASE